MSARLYCPIPLDSSADVDLPAPAAHHAARVLRLKAGDAVVLFNGEGGEYDATLSRIDGGRVGARVERHRAVERESPLAVTLAQCLASADRMDLALQKAVELGVAAIQPLISTRSVSRVDAARADKRLAHWQQVVVSACEQCGRNRVPMVHPLRDLAAWLQAPSAAPTRWRLDPGAEVALASLPRPSSTIECLVGPEGGLDPRECALAGEAGFTAVRAGPRVLRTETAGAAVLAAIGALWGDWR
jgi:16S rRNA (uracil1498-N3)-methyltransferase